MNNIAKTVLAGVITAAIVGNFVFSMQVSTRLTRIETILSIKADAQQTNNQHLSLNEH